MKSKDKDKIKKAMIGFLAFSSVLFAGCSKKNEANTEEKRNEPYEVVEIQNTPINTPYITDNPEIQIIEEQEEKVNTDVYAKLTKVAFLFSDKSFNHPQIKYESGQIFKVLEVDGDFATVIDIYGNTGYVESYLLNNLTNEEIESIDINKIFDMSQYSNLYAIINQDAYMYSEKDEFSYGIAYSAYQKFYVIGIEDAWAKVVDANNNQGYIKAGNLSYLSNDKFIEIDLSEQKLRLYQNNEVILETPVTTGKDETPSDEGLFAIYQKQQDTVLRDAAGTYASPVKYWMPYNGGEGIHDASWRNEYGNESYHYNGSHGCINTPLIEVEQIYNLVDVGTQVNVHR